MRRWIQASLLVLLAVGMAACVNEREARKREAQKFMQNSTGEYVNDAGELMFIAPVYSRMIGFDTFYIERSTARGPSQRLVALEPSPDGEKLIQFSYAFTQPAQWREVREHPELLAALQPADVRPAGTCNIQLGEDLNTLTYTCGGSPPMNYKRVQHNVEP
jgi:hypothetical protein